MKNRILLAFAFTLALGSAHTVFAQNPAFTYQGKLMDECCPASGSYDMIFKLYNAASGGAPLATMPPKLGVQLADGLFTTSLDFGIAPFDGSRRWLEINVRTNNPLASYIALNPRTELTPTPYALYAHKAGSIVNGSVTASQLAAAQPVQGQVLSYNGSALMWQTPPSANGWSLNGNAGGSGAFLGTINNYPVELRVNNTRALRLEPNATSPNLIGGHPANSVGVGTSGATIAGGGSAASFNSVTGGFGTVGGGEGNIARGGGATIAGGTHNETSGFGLDTIGGGYQNRATGDASTISGGYENETAAWAATVGGGTHNIASGVEATVGGGAYNLASATHATISGGNQNIASGLKATVGGGENNAASANYATVSGGLRNSSGYQATVGGGLDNRADGIRCTVAGGGNNVAQSYDSTVSGGYGNTANGFQSTVPGGAANTASGDFSFAAGRRAKALHACSFVWGDATDADVASTAPNQFLIRASGGVKVQGTLTTSVLTITGGADVAEPFQMSVNDIPKGAVVTIDEANPGRLKMSEHAYDTRVAGIVSGANGVNPGITLQQEGLLEGGQNVALSGRVYVQADASEHSIKPGDLLTTSDVPGHAMKAANPAKATGAILGKAMTALESGRGMVLVLVSLQ